MEIFDEMCEKFGLPKFEFDEDGSTVIDTESGGLVINRIAGGDQYVLSAPLGTIGGLTRIHVYGALLAANGFGGDAFGRIITLNRENDELLLQSVVDTSEMTPDALMREVEAVVTLAVEWKQRIEDLIAESDEILAAEENDDGFPVEAVEPVTSEMENSHANLAQFV